jgi:hypothetical protein
VFSPERGLDRAALPAGAPDRVADAAADALPARPLLRPPEAGRPDPAPQGSAIHLRLGPAQLAHGFLDDLRRLTRTFDLVLVHVGPVTWTPIALAVARQAAAVVAVVDVDADPDALRQLKGQLDAVSSPLTGLLVTHSRRSRASRGLLAAGWARTGIGSARRSRTVKHAAT